MSSFCYQCNTLVSITNNQTTSVCPRCSSRFIEPGTGSSSAPVSPPDSLRSSPSNSDGTNSEGGVGFSFRRRRRRSTGDNVQTSLYNPIILMRSPPQTTGGDVTDDGDSSDRSDAGRERLYRLFYNDESGTGLRPLPPGMAEILLGAGFDRLLDQLTEIEVNRPENAPGPASKAAIELMPSVEIMPGKMCSDLDCAICHEEFTISSDVREMPCKHLYHSDCILSWLSIKNSCPICRHELPIETVNNLDRNQNNNDNSGNENENEPFGITIWRLPGGGYAVGRYSGSNNYALPGSIGLGSQRRRSGGGGGGLRRLFGGFISVCKRVALSSWVSLTPPTSLSESETGSPDNLSPRTRSMSIS